MKITNTVERIRTPFHEQLLVLIPMLRALEDHRESFDGILPPLLLEIEYHKNGALTVDLSDAPISEDGRVRPELTLTIYNGSSSRAPLTYQHAFALTWSYLSRNMPMNSIEYEAMYKSFWMSWAIHLFKYEQHVQELGLA